MKTVCRAIMTAVLLSACVEAEESGMDVNVDQNALKEEEAKWIEIIKSEPGTPAEIKLYEESNPQATIYDVIIYGFWMNPVFGFLN